MKYLLRPNDVKSSLPDYVTLDARFRLSEPAGGARLFAEEHLPGAQFVDLETELSGVKTGANGRHPLPTREALTALFSRLGISRDTPVLAYDDADHAGAARLWLLLRWMGHENAYVLDGGLKAWKAAGLPTENGAASARAPASFPERAALVEIINKESLPGRFLVDARAPARYRGEVEPLDAQAGHIPGAVNLFYQNLLGEGGSFRPVPELGRLLPSEPATFYCGSGVTAAVPLLAAAELGRPASLYAGSFSEWSAQGGHVAAKGEAP